MVPPNRKQFEQEYRDWILLMARDAAYRLAMMPPEKQQEVLSAYKRLRDPRLVVGEVSDQERILRLVGERLKGFIVVETEAVSFFPSMYSYLPGALDYAVAMSRRFFARGLWYPIISLNSEYIRRASDRILAFTLDHELEMSRLFLEISGNLRSLSSDDKREMTDSAGKISLQKLGITPDELREDEMLMHQLSLSQPLIPKSYAERAMLIYLEDRIAELGGFGQKSRSQEEAALGEELYQEFRDWSAFSQESYELFVREIGSLCRDAHRGYG
jgi:hypothetical protein